MSREVLRFGIIGGGLMGREFAQAASRWIALMDLDAYPEITAVCDLDPAALEWFRARLPSLKIATSDWREVLESDVDAVYCAVPHHLHGDLYAAIIESGKHLLAEKPFGIDLEANDRIMRAVRRHPGQLVRVSSEFPFFPGAQRIVEVVNQDRFGRIIEVRSGFLHSSDLDPRKQINWKRRVETNGEYGCLGDLGMHAVHLPLRFGWIPQNVRALLLDVMSERPGPEGHLVRCDTWDNAILATEVDIGKQRFPMILEAKRVAPGEMNTWYLEIQGTDLSIAFTTKHPRTLQLMLYEPGAEQAWQSVDIGYTSPYRTTTGHIFEFGFPDAILQMWAAFVDECVHGQEGMLQPFTCATPEEAALSHRLFTAALESERTMSVVTL